MAAVAYNIGKKLLQEGKILAGSTNLRAALVITSKTGADNIDLATMAAIDAVGTVALHATRATLASVTAAVDNTNDRVNIGAATFSFAAAAGVTALAVIIYDATTDTSDTTRIPIAFDDTNFGAGVPLDGGINITVPTDLFRVA